MTDPVVMTTTDILDAVRLRLKSLNRNDSDYEAAKVLGVSHGAVSHWRTRRHTMDDKAGLAAANFLELEQEYVLFCLHLERAKDENTRSFWRRLAEKIHQQSHVAVLSLFTVLTVFAALPHLPE